MSTKISFYYTDKIHLYQECCEENTIYLDYREEKIQTKIEMKIKDFLKMAKCFDYQSLEKQTHITDEEITQYCIARVEERLKYDDGIRQFMSCMIYGDKNLDKEQQIKNGVQHFIQKRDELKKFFQEINHGVNKINFGLESIVAK